ncbi:MAG: hypothetical protein GY834_07535 [Bacteroidetes bacterium]|jgi:hypothetical protein|nr:hypothetical protein [Bacteroidota bacterium]
MKVKIQVRRIYHKFAEIETDIDENEFDHYRIDNGKYTSIDEFIIYKEEDWIDDLEHKMNESEFVLGNGIDDLEGMNEVESESEYRYECEKLRIGGHL